MRNRLKNRDLSERPAARAILALGLAAALAAFGCTTNKMPGNGDPSYTGPSSVAPAATPGSSSGNAGTPPPMTSSYRGADGITVNSSRIRQSATDAAAVIASQRRVMVLGTSAPGPANRPYVSDGRTGNFTYPALQTNPIVTVNSSIHSVNAGAAITSGAGGVDNIAEAAVFPDSGSIVTPTSAASGVTPTAATGASVTATPVTTTSGTATVLGTSEVSATIPTTAALGVSPTVASGAGGARVVGVRSGTAVTTTGATANSVTITNAGGRVTVTNAGSTGASRSNQ